MRRPLPLFGNVTPEQLRRYASGVRFQGKGGSLHRVLSHGDLERKLESRISQVGLHEATVTNYPKNLSA